MTTDKIYLVGFMASGKSTVARHLAQRMHWHHEDIDDLIEARERQTIAELFAKRGEPYFRAVEKDILKLLLPIRQMVVATGGGTFADPENRSTILMDGTTIWIDLPLAELIPRIPLDGRRPLAADRAALERLYAARVDTYRLAHLRVNASRGSPGVVAERILDALAQFGG
jgi:shikimate kinase